MKIYKILYSKLFEIIFLFFPLFALCNDKEIIVIENYLNNIKSLSAKFEQISPEGVTSFGFIYLQRPGKMKIEYINPSHIDIFIKNNKVTYFDKDLDEISNSYNNSHILNFLTKENICFSEDIFVFDSKKKENVIEISISNPENQEDGTMTLVFDKQLHRLIGINIITLEGKVTKLYLSNLQININLAQDIFKLDRNFLNLIR